MADMMTNQEIARILVHISEILGVQGENPFKIRAYTRASQTIESLTYQLAFLEDKDKIAELPGIGEGIFKKIRIRVFDPISGNSRCESQACQTDL